ncbi:hypothetical protein [Actinomadura sp. RB99]|uniref:hypothetical protein n=1 Tax=Actinomadura sp. RB99 TaxID=2691577 RepID=UPI001686E93E|nr:hypothetical protein [Actinomadura sp. RB99]
MINGGLVWPTLLLGTTASAALVLTSAASAEEISQTFDYTGAPQTFTIPDGVCTMEVDAFGGAGGDAVYGSPGGRGARVSAPLAVRPGQQLTVNVAGAGTGGDLNVSGSMARGGYGGGGAGGSYNDQHTPGNGAVGAGGGGATTVSLAGEPIIIAGGGGGGAGSFTNDGSSSGGDGGDTGTDGASSDDAGAGGGGAAGGNGGAGGAPGQPVSEEDTPGFAGGAGAGRQGGDAAINVGDPHMGTGGGGGAGARGGGAGGSSSGGTLQGGGGGGGSSLGPPEATMDSGVREGNGEVIITYETGSCEEPTPPPKPTVTPTAKPTPIEKPTKPTECPKPKSDRCPAPDHQQRKTHSSAAGSETQDESRPKPTARATDGLLSEEDWRGDGAGSSQRPPRTQEDGSPS